jgi:hypothetical protein
LGLLQPGHVSLFALGVVAACGSESFSAIVPDSGAGGAPIDAPLDRAPGDGSIAGAAGGPLDAHSEASNPEAATHDSAPLVDGGPPVDASNDARPPVDAGADARDANPPPCRGITDCPMGQNCMASRCVAAQVSCAAQKSSYPASTDGVYWISPAGVPHRAYCDMAISAELCTEIEGEHRGRTRDRATLAFVMKSVLLWGDGVCRIWALRGADGYPISQLSPVSGVPAGATCPALGFVADGVLGNCQYGIEHGDCGFGVSAFHVWGNSCSGCPMNAGEYDRYTLQGPVSSGAVITSVQGTVVTTCKLR